MDYRDLWGRVYFRLSFDAEIVERVDEDALPRDWRDRPPQSAQHVGERWLQEKRSAVLRVPSVIIPHAYNYVLNPNHPDFSRIDVAPPHPLPIDQRLTDTG